MSESIIPGNESLTTEISLVNDLKVCPTLPSTPVAFSMNCFGVENKLNDLAS